MKPLQYCALIWSVVLLSFYFVQPAAALASPPKLRICIKTSPESACTSQLIVEDHDVLISCLQKAIVTKATELPLSDTTITIEHGNQRKTYIVDGNGALYDKQNDQRLEMRVEAKKMLMDYVYALRKNHYGAMLSWQEVKDILPRKSKFAVIDLETGLMFYVQRRAGSHHADVQPLTKADTAIMKRIYDGKWSWRRKAIVVRTDSGLIAASMHGMPHGGDGIPDNDFRGHFCIHFLESTTHRSRAIDPEHQLMVRKAAGQVREYLDAASPFDVADTFLMAFNMGELEIMRMTFSHVGHPQLSVFLHKRHDLIRIQPLSLPKRIDATKYLSLDVPIEVAVTSDRGQEQDRMVYTFHMKRTSFIDPWKIDFISFISSSE